MVVATFNVHCHFCPGDQEVASRDVLLTTHDRRPWLNNYRFTCPTCHEEIVKAADAETVRLLVSGVAERKFVNIPAELDDPARTGPPINHDDLFEFHSALQDGFEERAAEECRG